MSDYKGCSGEHQRGGPSGHCHGTGTMWVECDPRKLHHHHDMTCLAEKDAEIERLKGEVERERKNADMLINFIPDGFPMPLGWTQWRKSGTR